MGPGSDACRSISRSCSRTVPVVVVGLLATFTANPGRPVAGAEWEHDRSARLVVSARHHDGALVAVSHRYADRRRVVGNGCADHDVPQRDESEHGLACRGCQYSGQAGPERTRDRCARNEQRSEMPSHSPGAVQRQVAAWMSEIRRDDVSREHFAPAAAQRALRRVWAQASSTASVAVDLHVQHAAR